MQVYTARFMLPVASPAIRDAAVAVDEGRIVYAGPDKDVLKAAGPEAEVRDLGEAAILPGLVNAHTHLELSWMGQDPPTGGDYATWLRELLDRCHDPDEAAARAAAEEGLRAMADRGTVAVGDVANETWIGPIIARSGLHAIVFYELYGLKNEEAESRLEQAAEQLETLGQDPDLNAACGRVQIALTAHAPHTTSQPLLKALAGRSTACGDPLSLHVAESAAEVALLRDGSGPLSELFRERDFFEQDWKAPGATPVSYLHRLGVLSPRTLAVHCVHLDQQDHSLLQAGRVTVVACPRSNARLGVGTAAIPKLMKQGVPVALGTDSLASAPSLDLLAEMAALIEDHPGLSPAAVLRMATLNGARALGLADRLGSIEPGKLAELVVVPVADAETKPLVTVCSNPPEVFRLADAPWEPPT